MFLIENSIKNKFDYLNTSLTNMSLKILLSHKWSLALAVFESADNQFAFCQPKPVHLGCGI